MRPIQVFFIDEKAVLKEIGVRFQQQLTWIDQL